MEPVASEEDTVRVSSQDPQCSSSDRYSPKQSMMKSILPESPPRSQPPRNMKLYY